MAGRRWRINWPRLGLSFAMAAGIALILYGFVGAVTGPAQSGLPDEIERIQPERGDKVLSQSSVVADLIAGYGGRLEIDGVPFATANTQEAEPTGVTTPDGSVPVTTVVADPNAVRFDAGTNTLSYQPRPGAVIDRFSVGRHFVKVIYWKLTEGEAISLSYTWYFDVSA